MKLSELAQCSGVSTASIKYYIHVGILSPGRKKNATTAVYSREHVHRLELITCLRRDLGAPIDSIAVLTRAIEDAAVENLELMGICQRLTLEANKALYSPDSDEPAANLTDADVPAANPTGPDLPGPNYSDPDVSAALAVLYTMSEPLPFETEIRSVLEELELPDVSPTSVVSMAHVLGQLQAAGYVIDRESIRLHIQALAAVAALNTAPITDDLSRDEICVAVIRGITLHNRLLLATSAVVHASFAARPRT